MFDANMNTETAFDPRAIERNAPDAQSAQLAQPTQSAIPTLSEVAEKQRLNNSLSEKIKESLLQETVGAKFTVSGTVKATQLTKPNSFGSYSAEFLGAIEENGEKFSRRISSRVNKQLFDAASPYPIDADRVDGKTWKARAIVRVEAAPGSSGKTYCEFEALVFDLATGEVSASGVPVKVYDINPFYEPSQLATQASGSGMDSTL
mgnify:FL=1